MNLSAVGLTLFACVIAVVTMLSQCEPQADDAAEQSMCFVAVGNREVTSRLCRNFD